MALPQLVIGNKNYSSWSMRPWLALRAAGIRFEEVLIPLYTPASKSKILELSPSGKVPAFIEGKLVTWESLAICERAAELAPAAELWPTDPAARSLARSVSTEMHAGFSALRSLCPCNLRIRAKRTLTPEVESDVTRVQAIWRTCRERHGNSGDFLFGRFSTADAMYAPVVTRFRSWGIPLDPKVRGYAEAVLAYPHFREWETGALQELEQLQDSEPTPAELLPG